MKNSCINKRKMILIAIILLIPLVLFSRSGVKSNGKYVIGYDSPERKNGVGIRNIKYRIIPLKRQSNPSIITPQKIEITDSIIFILDQNKLISYDFNGNFLHAIGNYGYGHDEYMNLSGFYIDSEKNVILFDSYKNTLLKFTKNGDFLSAIKLSSANLKCTQSILPIDEHSLFIYNYLFNNSYQLCKIINIKDNTEKEISSTPMCTNNTMEHIGANPYCFYNGNIRYLRPFDNSVYNLMDGSTFCIDTKKKVYTDRELSSIKDFSITTYANLINHGAFGGFTDIFETNKYIMLASYNTMYILVDKGKMKCTKFEYGLKTKHANYPLYNIKGAYGNQLIGILSMKDAKNMILASNKKMSLTLKSFMQDSLFDHYIIMYDLEDAEIRN